jgi:hypothetical protein
MGTLWELYGNNGEYFGNVVGTLWEHCGNSMETRENTVLIHFNMFSRF